MNGRTTVYGSVWKLVRYSPDPVRAHRTIFSVGHSSGCQATPDAGVGAIKNRAGKLSPGGEIPTGEPPKRALPMRFRLCSVC